MSQLEIAQNRYYSARVALVKGLGILNSTFNAPINGTSKVTSITRVVLGGVAGRPYASVVNIGFATVPFAVANAQSWDIEILSDVASDTSTYLVTWFNTYEASPSYAQETPGVAAQLQAVNVQYTP